MCCGAGLDRAEARRRKVIDAARILFVEHGFHATGVAQIARQSDIAVGQIYRDFEGKEAIVAAIVDADCTEFMAGETLHSAISAGDRAAVRDWIRHFLLAPDKSEADRLFAEIVAESARNDRVASIFTRMSEDVRRNMLAALAFLAPGDHLEARRSLLADLILTQALGLMQQRLLRSTIDTDTLAKTVLALVERDIEEMRAIPDARAGLAALSRRAESARATCPETGPFYFSDPIAAP